MAGESVIKGTTGFVKGKIDEKAREKYGLKFDMAKKATQIGWDYATNKNDDTRENDSEKPSIKVLYLS